MRMDGAMWLLLGVGPNWKPRPGAFTAACQLSGRAIPAAVIQSGAPKAGRHYPALFVVSGGEWRQHAAQHLPLLGLRGLGCKAAELDSARLRHLRSSDCLTG